MSESSQNPYLREPAPPPPAVDEDPYAPPAYDTAARPATSSPSTASSAPSPTPPAPRRSLLSMPVLVPLVLSLGVNAFTVFAVWRLGWPAGNVFLIFWTENVVVGLLSLPMIFTARGVDPEAGRTTIVGRIGLSLAYVFGYGLASFVHLVVSILVAVGLGVDTTPVHLWLPALLIVVRYVIELITTWFLGGVRQRVSPGEVMVSSFRRVGVLHVAVGLGFLLTIGPFLPKTPEGDLLPGAALVPVLILVGLKAVSDVWSTTQAARA